MSNHRIELPFVQSSLLIEPILLYTVRLIMASSSRYVTLPLAEWHSVYLFVCLYDVRASERDWDFARHRFFFHVSYPYCFDFKRSRTIVELRQM